MSTQVPLFLLGTHQPGWLAKPQVAAERVPLFVSDRRLRSYKTLPRAAAPWAVDSGGFTELQKYGRWTVTPAEYVARLRRYRDETGNLMWAAQQDWMCEPIIINGGVANGQHFTGTHLSVPAHQHLTVRNYAHLLDLAPDLHIVHRARGAGQHPGGVRTLPGPVLAAAAHRPGHPPPGRGRQRLPPPRHPRGRAHHPAATRQRPAPAAPVRVQDPRPGPPPAPAHRKRQRRPGKAWLYRGHPDYAGEVDHAGLIRRLSTMPTRPTRCRMSTRAPLYLLGTHQPERSAWPARSRSTS